MDTPDDLAPIRRILVALDATRASAAALEAAVSLAEHLEAELLGLFVEDVNLLRLAALPFAHEVGFPSARARRLESDDMERTLRAQATLAQQALVTAVHQRRVPWSFRVVRGQVVTELLAASQQADLIAIAMTRTRVSRRARPPLTPPLSFLLIKATSLLRSFIF
jgi:nucleotide-binding universal stress UspA family protein